MVASRRARRELPKTRQGGVTALGKRARAIPGALCLALARLGGSEIEK